MNTREQLGKVTFGADGLVPAIVQDAVSGTVLMLGYMNEEALCASIEGGRVVFFSRSKQRLWEKGETSGHTLDLVDLRVDCDRDALLVLAHPRGPTCHNGTLTCFGDDEPHAAAGLAFLATLEGVINERAVAQSGDSYTAKLLAAGPRRIAQKVGEEGVEVALAATQEDTAPLIAESADLLYHLLVLLRSRGVALGDVTAELERRHGA